MKLLYSIIPILLAAIVAYILLVDRSSVNILPETFTNIPKCSEEIMVVCDERGVRYGSECEAERAGLSRPEYGATYCNVLPPVVGLHPSWDVDEDGLNDCESDGSCDHTIDYTRPRDVVEAELNAIIDLDNGGEVEILEDADQDDSDNDSDDIPKQSIYIGLTISEAILLAERNNVPFRIIERDGESLAVTADYIPGRINARVVHGIVIEFEVE